MRDDHPASEEWPPLVPVEPVFAQGDDVSDDDDRRRPQVGLGDPGRDVLEGPCYGPLLWHGTPPDTGDRCLPTPTGLDQPGRDLLQSSHAHVQNERLGTVGQLLPVDVRAALGRVLVPGDERDAGRDVSVRNGYACVCGDRDAARHAWDDLEGQSGSVEGEGLLTTAAEDVG